MARARGLRSLAAYLAAPFEKVLICLGRGERRPTRKRNLDGLPLTPPPRTEPRSGIEPPAAFRWGVAAACGAP